MNKILTTFAFLGVFLLGVVITATMMSKEKPVGGNNTLDFFFGNFTPTSVSVSSTRQQLLAANSGRRSAELCNTNKASSSDATSGVYLLLSSASSSASTSTGRPIYGGECYDKIGKDFNYTGEVWGLVNSAVANRVSVQEYFGN